MNSRALRRALTRAAGALAVLTLSTSGLLISGTTAQAADASGTLTLTSDPGDIIGDGLSYSFDSSASDRFSAISYPAHDGASVSVTGADGDDWVLDLAAAHGKTLTTGTYSDVASTNDPQRTGPGLSVRHFGTDCFSATGSFTITTITFGPYGYLSELDASFEQHCEGAPAAIRGKVHVTNPTPTPALEIGVAVSAEGQADKLNGKALVRGTVTCNEPVTVGLTGSVTEVAHRVLINVTSPPPRTASPAPRRRGRHPPPPRRRPRSRRALSRWTRRRRRPIPRTSTSSPTPPGPRRCTSSSSSRNRPAAARRGPADRRPRRTGRAPPERGAADRPPTPVTRRRTRSTGCRRSGTCTAGGPSGRRCGRAARRHRSAASRGGRRSTTGVPDTTAHRWCRCAR
jgi:hypothetical protein